MLRSALGLMVVAGACMTAGTALAGEASRAPFGAMPDGHPVEAVTLRNGHGLSATVISYGAALQSLQLPDRAGKTVDIALGYPSIEGYLRKSEYFGATVGRFANRIANGQFTLDGKRYQTPQNDHGQSLHGGSKGFDKVLWEVLEVQGGAAPQVRMRYVSPDGDQGYPGTLQVEARYALGEDNALTIEYTATTDRPTVVNISNHAYWNLAGEGAAQGAMGHLLSIHADAYTPVGETLIPTGALRPVAGTVFDFRTPRPIGERVRNADEPQLVFGRGYDHNFATARDVSKEPRLQATLVDPSSGRGFELWSNQPGLQFYSGNFLDGTVVGKSRHLYREGDAVVLEPQLFPDAVNQPAFLPARLAPGETYRNLIVYRFTSAAPAKGH